MAMSWSRSVCSSQTGCWIEPASTVMRSVVGICARRRAALVVGQMMFLMEGEARRRGRRGVPMLPLAEVMNMLDIFFGWLAVWIEGGWYSVGGGGEGGCVERRRCLEVVYELGWDGTGVFFLLWLLEGI